MGTNTRRRVNIWWEERMYRNASKLADLVVRVVGVSSDLIFFVKWEIISYAEK